MPTFLRQKSEKSERAYGLVIQSKSLAERNDREESDEVEMRRVTLLSSTFSWSKLLWCNSSWSDKSPMRVFLSSSSVCSW